MHVLRLGAGVGAVGVRPPPGARPHHRAAQVLVAVVQRGALARLLRRAGEQAHRDRRVRRPGRGGADRVLVDPGRLRVDADRVRVAEPALARPHRHRRVALRELDRVEALGDRVLQVLRRLVLAEADEALVAAVVEDRARHRRLADVAGDGADRLDVVGQVGRDEDAAALVVLDARAGLGEELVVRLRAAGHHDQVRLHVAGRRSRPAPPCRPCPAPRSPGCRPRGSRRRGRSRRRRPRDRRRRRGRGRRP